MLGPEALRARRLGREQEEKFMTMTNEHIVGEHSSRPYPAQAHPYPGTPARRLDGEEAEPAECDCIVGPDEEAWLRLHLQHRNNLRLVVAGALGFGLALALGLSAAWQIDRW